ncbi:MAG: hypothetical protein ABSH32_09350 [Bryobacteraceae bacterium]|jgi:hypothetical protein
MKPSLILLTVIVALAAICLSCRSLNSPIETVRNGVLTNYNSTTVGKAFEGTFQNAKWTTIETAKGQTVVQFDGTVETMRFGKVTTAEELSANTVYEASSMRSKCMASLGVTGRFTELMRQHEETRRADHTNDPGWNYDWGWLQLNEKLLAINTSVAHCMNNSPTPVKFQFTLSADQESFELSYVDEVFDHSAQRALSFIYGF